MRADNVPLTDSGVGRALNWVILPLRRYAEFSGRSRRMEFWWFAIAQSVATIVLGAVENVLGINGTFVDDDGPLIALFGFATFVPGIAVSVRRLHDIGRSGWWLLTFPIAFTLLIFGAVNDSVAITMTGVVALLAVFIVLFVFSLMNGTPGSNKYGTDPKDPTDAQVFA